MNKTLHRLVFNAARGQVMAVSEAASACGKSASGETTPSADHGAADSGTNGSQAPADIGQAAIKTIAISALAFGVLCTPAQAHTRADRSAPGQTSTTAVQPNGSPQVVIPVLLVQH